MEEKILIKSDMMLKCPHCDKKAVSVDGKHCHYSYCDCNGLKLMNDDISKFIRYNHAVLKVGYLSLEELIKLQNDGIASIYRTYWRWISVLKKSGVFGFLLAFNKLIRSLVFGRYDLIYVGRNYWRISQVIKK